MFRYKKPLSYNELCEKILSEPTISLFSFIPVHNKLRQIKIESRKYVNKSDWTNDYWTNFLCFYLLKII